MKIRSIILLLLIWFASCGESINSSLEKIPENTQTIQSDSVSYVIFNQPKDSIPIMDSTNVFYYYDSSGTHVSIDTQEVRKIEQHVITFMKLNQDNYDWSNYQDYRFQYIPAFNEFNQKLVWINGNCKDEQRSWLKFIEQWKDGGACHFNWVYNIETNSMQYLNINGL